MTEHAFPASRPVADTQPIAPAVTRSRWIAGAAAFAFFIALTLANTWPLAAQLDTSIGQHGDAFFSVWRLAWVAHQLKADPLHVFDANIFYPERRTLAYSDAMLLPAVALAPFHWAGVQPLVVYNVFLLSAFALNALAAYWLVVRLVGSQIAGVLAGVIFAFSPYRFDHFDHLEMQLSFWIPLAVLAWHRAVERPTPRACLAVAGWTTAQVLSCIYYAVFLLTWFAVLTIVWFVRTPLRGLRVGALMLLVPTVVFALYSIPYLGNRERLGDRPTGQIAGYSARPRDFVSAPYPNRLYGWSARYSGPERHLFPGVAALILLVLGGWPPLDRRRIVHLTGLCVALVLVFGSNAYVYNLLYKWVLPYRGLRVPARATVLVLLGTSVLAGYGVRRLATWMRPRVAGAIAGAAVCVASIEYLSKPLLRPVDRISPWYGVLRTVPDAVVFEWPVTVPWRLGIMVDVNYMYRSTIHWRPLLNGYSGFYPASYFRLLMRMRSFPDSRSIQYLQQQGATIVVVHELPGAPNVYGRAMERLVRDPKVQVIASGIDSGTRVTFFRLAPPSEP
jgi:hypothetical protein